MKRTLLRGALLFSAITTMAACSPSIDDPTPIVTPDKGQISLLNVTATSLQISWTLVQNASAYEIQLRDSQGEVTIVQAEVPPVTFDNLESESDYEVRYKCMANKAKKYADSEYCEWVTYQTSEGQVAKRFKQGDGSEAAPYVIKTAPQLALLAQLINEEAEGYCGHDTFYELGADIDLSGYDWNPIGDGSRTDYSAPYYTPSPAFKARFDGKNYTVSGLNVNIEKPYTRVVGGLFGANMGSLTNVKVVGSVKVKATTAETDGFAVAGGLTAYNCIQKTDEVPLVPSGYIVNCHFEGRVEAEVMQEYVSAIAGGLVGANDSGNIDECTALIGSNDYVRAISSSSPQAGGLLGFLNSGRVYNNKTTVAGEVIAKFAPGVPHSGAPSFLAGGFAGSLYRTTANADKYGCTFNDVVISGKVAVDVGEGGATKVPVNIGGLTGSIFNSLVGRCNVTISGTLSANGNGSINMGGLVGNMQEGHMGTCIVDVTSTGSMVVTGTDEAPTSLIAIAGVLGNAKNTSPAVLTLCQFNCAGRFEAQAKSTVQAGGLAGAMADVSICSVNFQPSSQIVLNSTVRDVCFGGLMGSTTATSVHLCYAILNGSVSLSAATTIYSGGVMGRFGMVTGTIYRWLRYSYAVIKNDITLGGAATSKYIGGVFGRSESRGSASTNFWWAPASIPQGDGNNASKSGLTKIASNDEAGFTEAGAAMNQAITDNEYNNGGIFYVWSPSLAYLILQ